MAPLKSTTTTGGLPSGVSKLMTSSSAMVVAAGDRSPSWIAASSAVRSAGATAGASQDAAVEEEAASSLLLLRRRTAVDAEAGVEVDESAATAATTFDWSSAGQLPTSAANSSLPSAVSTSAMLVADDGTEMPGPGHDAGRREATKEGSEKRRSRQSCGPAKSCYSSHARMCYTTLSSRRLALLLHCYKLSAVF